MLHRQQRAFVRHLNLPYLNTELLRLRQYRTVRTTLAPLLRELSLAVSSTNVLSTGVNKKGQQLRRRVNTFTYRLPVLPMRTTLAAFRLAVSHRTVDTKNIVQASRFTALTIRNERTRLLETRYYRTRAKLRLPNQRVLRAERKRQELRLFARHTLKRPATSSGRAKLLLPSASGRVLTA